MNTTERLPHPPLLTDFPFNVGTRLLAPGDIRATPQQRDAYLDRYTRQGDPAADAVVEMLRRLPPREGRRMFDTATEYGIDAVPHPPEELVEFFRQVDTIPYWLDTDRLDRGCRVIGRTGIIGITALSMLALMGGYMASRVTKTLVSTGNLEHMAGRRIAETTSWFMDVTTPGGLQRHAPGCKTTIHVRLMHALARAGMNRRPDWSYDEWDHPINQSQMAGTNMLFGLATLSGSQALGIHFTHSERDAVYHLWRYVGHLLGITPDLLPADEHDNWRIWWLQAHYEFGHPDADSTRLAQALTQALAPLVVGNRHTPLHHAQSVAVTGIMCAYARLTLGHGNADILGLPDQKAFRALVIASGAAIKALEIPRQLIPGATSISEALGRRSQLALAKRMTLSCRHRTSR
ncbi:oxygenase MpaB family protein [Nocardia nova]|uniref:oxygenase MpaB family protein n=1 Tax=Nocardia nova TaxID=37330 RepID=UPI003404A38E